MTANSKWRRFSFRAKAVPQHYHCSKGATFTLRLSVSSLCHIFHSSITVWRQVCHLYPNYEHGNRLMTKAITRRFFNNPLSLVFTIFTQMNIILKFFLNLQLNLGPSLCLRNTTSLRWSSVILLTCCKLTWLVEKSSVCFFLLTLIF